MARSPEAYQVQFCNPCCCGLSYAGIYSTGQCSTPI